MPITSKFSGNEFWVDRVLNILELPRSLEIILEEGIKKLKKDHSLR
jgi:hypothetical protein